MKIVRKFLVINVVINIISMVVLMLLVNFILHKYFVNDMRRNVMYENAVFVTEYMNSNQHFMGGMMSREKEYKSPPFYKSYAPYNFLINSNGLIVQEEYVGEPLDIDILNVAVNNGIYSVYELNFGNNLYYGYNSLLKLDNEAFMAVTLYQNDDIIYVHRKIAQVFTLVIMVVALISIIVTHYLKAIVVKPMKQILIATNDIGNKNFDVDLQIKTNDEFEEISEAISKMALKLKNQDIEQKKFFENVSHEIKTPITVISGYAEGIKTDVIDNEDEVLQIIINQCKRLKTYLENIIYLSKLDTIKDNYILESNSVNDMISETLNNLDSLIIINELDVYYECKKDVSIICDREKIIRALTNIISNCIKYTNEVIDINVEDTIKGVKITIKDDGNGFDKKILDDPFGGNYIGEKEGSGVGLTIIKKVIDAHKSEIKIYNYEDGAVYEILLNKKLKKIY